ncbi:MAG TPA: peptide deformylase [Myxococcota bacterium]|nr:peptide deformylase [Myxococcota bacterium]HOA14282.1 peptide deformylase [Myxococcota bacterium]HOC99529.1 peptide deformylase [Myxococcota bacterium]HOH77653.1 peptide deformylase [Myxococcota bacterium]
MAILKIVKWPEEILSRKTVQVESVDDAVRRLLDDMAETMYASNGIGLAAPQVGSSLRVAVIDVPADGDNPATGLVCLVNPLVVSGDGTVSIDEGCLSFPGIEVPVKRSGHVVVEYLDRNGVPSRIEATDLAAICLQHEIDHLDGITMIDRVGPIRRKLAIRDYQKAMHKVL